MTAKHLRFAYITDLLSDSSNRRVLTIARRLNDDGTVTYGTAMNKPTTWIVTEDSRNYFSSQRIPGDAFNRKEGRTLAIARLENERTAITIKVPEGVHPLDAVLQDLADNVEGTGDTMYRIAQDELTYREFCDTLQGMCPECAAECPECAAECATPESA